MNIPESLKYTKSHEWLRFEGEKVYVGITDFAQDSLGDIVYIELPETGSQFSVDDEITTIESVKAAEPIFAPLSGKIVEVNEELNDSPEKINEDPYGTYIFVLEPTDSSERDALLDADAYQTVVEEEGD